jgi:hypothetical protein
MRVQAVLSGAVVALAAVMAPLSASAAELVANGGFETGTLSSWTGGGSFTGVQCPGGANPTVHGGNCSLFDGNVGSTDTLSQIVATVAGQSYDYSFWLLSDGGTPSAFTFSLGGVTLVSLTNAPASSGFTQFTGSVVAASSNATLAFGFRNDPGFWFLDDVSLVNGAAIPEPGSWALMIVGFLGAGAAIRSSRRASFAV